MTSSSRDPDWPALPTSAPTWGNKKPDWRDDEEGANEWRDSGMKSKRKARDQEISRGGSPPPKLEEDNFFTEGSSRKSNKPCYREKEEITDDDWYSGNQKVGKNSPPSRKLQKLAQGYVGKEHHASSCIDLIDSEEDAKFFKDLEAYEESSSDESEISSSEDEDQGDSENEEKDSEDSDTEDDATIGQIFREIERGTFDANKRKARFAGQQFNERKVTMSTSIPDEQDGKEETPSRRAIPRAGYFQRPASSYCPPTRGSCFLGTTEALSRLTRNMKDKWIRMMNGSL